MAILNTAAELAVEHWKLLRSCQRGIATIAPDQQKKAESQYRYAVSRLENLTSEMGLRLIEYEDSVYEPNLPITVVNADEFEENEGLTVEQTLEPTVMHDDRVLALGKVILKQGDIPNVSRD